MVAGKVSAVRELTGGVQAQVTVGGSGKYGWATLTIVSQSPDVMAAMNQLKAALRKEAHNTLVSAQEDEQKRGRKAIGTKEYDDD